MHVKLSTSRKLSMALLTLLAPAWQTLQLYVDPRLTTVKKMSTQKLGQQKIGQIWFLNFHQVVCDLNPSGWCLPSLLVIQSIRRVSRHGRLGKLESRVNSAAQQSKFRLSRVNLAAQQSKFGISRVLTAQQSKLGCLRLSRVNLDSAE